MLCYDLLNKQCQNQQSNQHQRQERHTNILTKNIEQKCHVIKFVFFIIVYIITIIHNLYILMRFNKRQMGKVDT